MNRMPGRDRREQQEQQEQQEQGMYELRTASRSALLAVVLSFVLAVAQAGDQSSFSAAVRVTSDYVYRGVSQTNGAAVQAGLDLAHPSGFFAGVTASNVDFGSGEEPDDGADVEFDYCVGYAHALSHSWTADAVLVRYAYPGTAPGVSYDYTELLLGVHLRERLSAVIGYTNDVFGEDEAGIAYQLRGAYPLPRGMTLGVAYGHVDLTDAYDSAYWFYQAGISRRIGPLTLGLTYHDTSDRAAALFGAAATRAHLVLDISAEF